MADEEAVQVPPAPPAGEIVTTRALLNTQFALYRNTLAFGGVANPSLIWSSMLRDDGSAILYYRELEEKDVDVANALDGLKSSVLKRDWSIVPANEDDGLAVDVADFVRAQLDQVADLDGVLDNMLDALGYGFSVQEMIYDTSEGQAELADIRDCPQELFTFGNRFEPQIGNLQFLESPYSTSGTEVPEQKFLVYSYRMRSRNRMGRPLLRSVFWPSWFKRNMLRLWSQYAEKGPGTAVVRYDDADSAEDKQKAAGLAQSLIENTAVAVPRNFDYDKELLTIARTMNPQVYENFTKSMQLDIVRRIEGETLTSFGGENGKGTQALGDVHADTKAAKAVGICKALQSVLNRQLVRPLVLWNFGPKAPMPKWKYEIEEKQDLTQELNLDKGLQSMGLAIPEEYVRKKYSVPAPENGEAVLTPAPVAGPAIPVPGEQADFSERRAARIAQWWRDVVEGQGRNPTPAEIAQAAAIVFAEPDSQAERDLAQFDRLVENLRDESLGLLHERVEQLATALEKTGGR